MIKFEEINANCLIKGLHNRDVINKVIMSKKVGENSLEVVYNHQDQILTK